MLVDDNHEDPQGRLFVDTVEVGETFHEALLRHPAPIHEAILRHIADQPVAPAHAVLRYSNGA